MEDFRGLPFLTKEQLRRHSPFGLLCADESEVVRIHSTSGTTGDPVIIPYTARDVATFVLMMARALRTAGVDESDRVLITPGYGLWTAGVGFQAGVEAIGACAIPTGPVPIETQMAFVERMSPTVIVGTASFALLLGETLRGRAKKPRLKAAVLGAEQWGEKRRAAIEGLLGTRAFDIYGMTETYGPGSAIDCDLHQGLHYWDDLFLFEVIDPVTGEVLPEGTTGELVVTTLVKEGLPLIRYRTRDLTSLLPGACPCGSPYPRIARVRERSDDMITYRGVNLFPSAVERVMAGIPGLGSEYRILLTTESGRDQLTLQVEREVGTGIGIEGARREGGEVPADRTRTGGIGTSGTETEGTGTDEASARELVRRMKTGLNAAPRVELLSPGSLERSTKKTKRVIDRRAE
jgi:phenylacetate-CoA ligase